MPSLLYYFLRSYYAQSSQQVRLGGPLVNPVRSVFYCCKSYTIFLHRVSIFYSMSVAGSVWTFPNYFAQSLIPVSFFFGPFKNTDSSGFFCGVGFLVCCFWFRWVLVGWFVGFGFSVLFFFLFPAPPSCKLKLIYAR